MSNDECCRDVPDTVLPDSTGYQSTGYRSGENDDRIITGYRIITRYFHTIIY
jgi:hypothetical protein